MTCCQRPLVLLLLLTATLWGCGADEFDPSPAGNREPAAELTRPLFVDLEERGVTRLQLNLSPEYVPSAQAGEPGEVRIFALVQDQDGNSLVDFDFNRFNFTVVLNPQTAPLTVDTEETDLFRELSGDRLVALVIDSSGSMEAVTETGETRMQVARDAARLFVGLMGPGDRTAVVDFDSSARTLEQLSADADALNRAIDSFEASGATNLGSAVGEAVRAVGSRPGKRAAIVLTDGDDTVDSVVGGPDVWLNNPDSSRAQALELARESGLIVYTVGLGTDLSETGIADLETIAAETGGQFFEAPTAASLETVFQFTIPGELDALPPVETFVVSFPNPLEPPAGKILSVPFRASVVYENANGVHFDKSSGAYTVP